MKMMLSEDDAVDMAFRELFASLASIVQATLCLDCNPCFLCTGYNAPGGTLVIERILLILFHYLK